VFGYKCELMTSRGGWSGTVWLERTTVRQHVCTTRCYNIYSSIYNLTVPQTMHAARYSIYF